VIVSPEAVSDVSAVVAPTAPDKLTVPVPAVSVNVCAPFTVEPAVEKLMFAPPPADVLIVGEAVRSTGPAIVTEPLVVVVILPPKLIAFEAAVPV
jgi:hypothetical protein